MLMSAGGVVFFEHRLREEPVLAIDSTDRPPGDTASSILAGATSAPADDRAPVVDVSRLPRPLVALFFSSIVSGFISAIERLSDSFSKCNLMENELPGAAPSLRWGILLEPSHQKLKQSHNRQVDQVKTPDQSPFSNKLL